MHWVLFRGLVALASAKLPSRPGRCGNVTIVGPGTQEGRMESIRSSRELAEPHPKPEWFSGPVYVHALNDKHDSTELEVLAVYFDPGSRTKPHTHSTEQLLYFVEGEGVVADRTKRRQYRAGGMAVIPAGEWHWHGATSDHAACHLSIRPGGPSAWPPDVPLEDWDTYMDGVEEG
jgi:quercetin dioxygenase-like cupin family protein